MIYLASGLVCLSIGTAYIIGMAKGYIKGYDHAIEDAEKASDKFFTLKEQLKKQQKNEE